MVPLQSQSETVEGEVQYATSHVYNPSLSLSDYIDRNGGESLKAGEKRIYVVRANGSLFLPSESRWFKRGDNAIQAGDTVVVPLDAERMRKLTLCEKVCLRLFIEWHWVRQRWRVLMYGYQIKS